jgi:2-oxoglutarate ferredoxin oxidoreductase subunit alpha
MEKAELMMGNIALAEGAIAAGCSFFAAYPITPSNEISEHLSRRMPETGGIFIQMEDEMASIGAVIGAAWAGKKAFTATSGPGFSLMQEHISHAANMEIPIVIVNMQRVSPGGGGITEMSADVMQAKWGGHGDYMIIALAPSSCQEAFDLAIEAFNYAGYWRTPVIILGDAVLAHMVEPVIVPAAEELKKKVKVWATPSGDPKKYVSFTAENKFTGKLMIPPAPIFGTPYHPQWAHSGFHTATGTMYEDDGMALPFLRRINDKITSNVDKIQRFETRFLDDASVIVICYGTAARSSLRAVKEARQQGIKAGYLRLITLWPFADAMVRRACEWAKAVVVPEMNYGQIVREVERVICNIGPKIYSIPSTRLHEPREIFEKIREAAQ